MKQLELKERTVSLTSFYQIEIAERLDKTGGTPYLNEAAAARYLLYSGHSWISFDNVKTFQMKIDYASKMGFHGLMVWVINLNIPNLEAPRSVYKGELIGHTQAPFLLVNLEHIFPAEMLALTMPRSTMRSSTLEAMPIDSRAISLPKEREDESEPLWSSSTAIRTYSNGPKRDPDSQRYISERRRCGLLRVSERGIGCNIVEMFDNIKPIKLKGHTLQPNNKTCMALQPYCETDYILASFNGNGASAASTSASYFDGKLNTHIQSDFGVFNVNFPPNPEDKLGT
ncbi:hypothetical protein AK830_g12143 [Neonectria ditissima]|uniref:Uncharacterized protein n=1 Tax=Neonectria ditissima TaxID=78410 RepID=A0A0P7B173_9HYPO|nr:hypothetical protein AK830_g12143 [Neonectria ditissima]